VSEGKHAIAQADELAIRAAYEARRPLLEGLAGNIRLICEQVLKTHDIPYHSVKFRIKPIASVLEKIPRKGLAPSLDKLEDVVGIRVICLYPKHVDPVVELLTRQFKVLEREDKRPEPNPRSSGTAPSTLSARFRAQNGPSSQSMLASDNRISRFKYAQSYKKHGQRSNIS
jgi:hypothetical protein